MEYVIVEKSKRINKLSFLIILGFSLSLFYHYAQGVILEKPYPANTFLFHPRYTFSDFTDVYRESIDLNPYIGENSGQFPFMILLGRVFGLLPLISSLIFFFLISIEAYVLLSIDYLQIRPWYSHATSIFVICFLSYPFLVTVDRANFELLLFILLLIFMHLFEKNKYLLSTIPLAFAIAMKVYPIIFLALFISEKKWKELFITLAIIIVITLGSLSLFQGGFYQNINYLLNLSNFSNNQLFNAFTSIEPGANVQRGVAVISLVKIVLGNANVIPSAFWIDNFKIVYLAIASIIGGLIILYVIIKKVIFWKKVSILVFLMLLLPPLSGDYKLILLYLPLFLFINKTEASRLDNLYILLFSILMIPKNYYYFPGLISDAWVNNRFQYDISIGMPINIFVLIIFTIVLLVNDKVDRLSD